MMFRIAAVLGFVLASINVQAQTHNLDLHVKETAGIRRSAYPVNARIPLSRGALKDASHVRLLLADKEVAVQSSTGSTWPDGSIQWLDLDFNATILPSAEQTYRVEYGDDVKSQVAGRGLTVNDGADTIQVGSVRFGKKAFPLVESVSYRQEDIKGPTGFTVVDANGSHDLTADGVKAEIVKPGPLYVVIRYSGKLALDASYSVLFTVTAEMPNSKTWVKYTANVEDSAKHLKEIAFTTRLAFGPLPWLWDFGTGSWSYGSFRNAGDSVVLTQTVKAGGGNEWQIQSGMKGQEQPYEVSGGSRPKVAEGWGHFQDGKEVIAFGFDRFGRQPGTYTVSFDGQGVATFRAATAPSAGARQLTIYQHYVASPTPIGAVTSPVSMINPLAAYCDRSEYLKAGLPVPPEAEAARKGQH